MIQAEQARILDLLIDGCTVKEICAKLRRPKSDVYKQLCIAKAILGAKTLPHAAILYDRSRLGAR